MVESEATAILDFFRPICKERISLLLQSKKGRAKFVRLLAHSDQFDPRFKVALQPREQTSQGIEKLLTARGAPGTCGLISERRELDGRQMSLSLALGKVIGAQMGTIVICVPGRLAYFENEDARFILSRPLS